MSEIKRFQTYSETSKSLGLAVYYLRKGVNAGWIPHVKCGCKVMINVPKLIEILDAESVNGICR